MLIKFSIKNWMSYRDETTFLLTSSPEQNHLSRSHKLDKYDCSVLPVSVIFGDSNSGKTNLMKALEFAQGLIVNGSSDRKSIKVDAYNGGIGMPTEFLFELLAENGYIYEYVFSITDGEISSEKLTIMKPAIEVIYERDGQGFQFDESLNDHTKIYLLLPVLETTQKTELFLPNTVSHQIDVFSPVYDWFKNTLCFAVSSEKDLTAASGKVYVLDDIFAEHHPDQAREIVENYLLSCNSKTRSQLLFSTHITELMDKDLFRCDEIWLTHRIKETELYCLCEFNEVEEDDDIRQSYLDGRMGFTPTVANHF